MRVTWDQRKQIQIIATSELVDLPAGTPWEMDDDEAVQRIDQADCAPVDKAEYKAKKAAREKRLAAPPEPEPAVEPTVEPVADAPPETGVRVKR